MEYDGKNDPQAWITTTRHMRDLSRVLEGTLEEIAMMARYYCNYESGNIGIPDWIEEAETFPDRKRRGKYYLIAEVISLLRGVLDGEVDKIRELNDTWHRYLSWTNGRLDWMIQTDFDTATGAFTANERHWGVDDWIIGSEDIKTFKDNGLSIEVLNRAIHYGAPNVWEWQDKHKGTVLDYMQHLWAMCQEDIAKVHPNQLADEGDLLDDPSEMTVGLGIGSNLATQIKWQLERIQNDQDGKTRFHMDQGITWGPDVKPYSLWDEKTLASRRAYAGQVITY